MKKSEVAKWLDDHGITMVNFIDPVDGSTVSGIGWQDIDRLIQKTTVVRGGGNPLAGTPCPTCGRWKVTSRNQCYGCKKPFVSCTCRR